MKVLFLTNIPTPYRVDFFNELGKKCELTVLFERKTADDRENSWLDYQVDRFEPVFLKGRKIGADSSCSFDVLKWIRNKKFDLIVVGGYSTPTGMIAIAYMRLFRKKFVLNTDGGQIKNDSRLKYLVKKFFISSADYWLSTGENTTKYLLKYGAKKDRIYRYPFSSVKNREIIKCTPEEKQEYRKRSHIFEEKTVLMVGQMIYRKGIDLLLKTAKEMKDVGFYIAGGLPTEEYLDIVDREKLNNVHFVGFMTREELSEYYMATDVFAMPTREDIWGLVVNEAMAKGLPVVTTDKCVAGVELIKDGVNGYIIPSENHILLKEKIELILESTEQAEKISGNNINRISDYTIEAMAQKHYLIFLEILENGSNIVREK